MTVLLLTGTTPILGFQVFENTSPDDASKSNGHSISYKSAQMMKCDWIVGSRKPVASGERLQQGSLTQGDSAILLWVAESSVSEPVALRGDSGTEAVPRHPAINPGICPA